MPDLPSGTVTFLFADIEGNTTLVEPIERAMAIFVNRHLALLRAAIESNHGVWFKIVRDAVQPAFPTAPDAMAVVAASTLCRRSNGPTLQDHPRAHGRACGERGPARW